MAFVNRPDWDDLCARADLVARSPGSRPQRARGILGAVTQTSDIAIVGGGIVGLATALSLTESYPQARLVIVDKESKVATHQTGHNSGVIHSGIYYKPGSLKARLCVEGGRLMKAFCTEHGIHWEPCGKLIVATDPGELGRLQSLHDRGADRLLGPVQRSLPQA